MLAKLPAMRTFSTASCICSTPGVFKFFNALITLLVIVDNCSLENVSSIDSILAFFIASLIFCALNFTISPVRFLIVFIIVS